MATSAVTSAWAKVSTNCSAFAVQNLGTGPLLRVFLVATTGSAPTGEVGFILGPAEFLSMTVSGQDLYLKVSNGAALSAELYHDGT